MTALDESAEEADHVNGGRRSARGRPVYVNGKWLAQAPSGTQRYATQVMRAHGDTPAAHSTTLVLPRDAGVPPWAQNFRIVRSRLRGSVFEQVSLPWLARRGHLYSLAGPAPILKRDQTVVMHDATPFRYPQTFRRAFVVWYRLMYAVLSRTARRVLTVSAFSRSELAEVLGVPVERFELAPCGADHVSDVPLVADELPFPNGTYALLVGNQAPHKNVPATAAALAAAGIRVAIVGGFQSQVFRSPATFAHDNVKTLGRVDDSRLEALYAGAGVLVAPSGYEGFGIPVVEAGRLSCPSVYATGSALGEVAGDGGIGFDPADTHRCVELVAALLSDTAARSTLGTRARANSRRFSWKQTARTIFGPDVVPTPRPADVDSGPCEQRRPLRVLHVTETFAAGTGVAVVGFARGSKGQGIEAFLLAQDRGSGLLDEIQGDPPFVRARILGPGSLRLWRGIGAAVKEIRPDVLHLHSSLAGAVGRIRLLASRNPLVVYSPHCFAFERRDVSRWQRWAFRTAERLLAHRTDGFVCVSPHEAALARQLRNSVPVTYVVNAFSINGQVKNPQGLPRSDGTVRPVSLGRITPQKDPAMFAAVAVALRATGAVEATWIGSGNDHAAGEALRAAAVHVTGWVPPHQVPELLARGSVYVHTATWEASTPIALLEAMAVGLVVVVRRIEAYQGMLPDEWLFDDVPSAVEMIHALSDPTARETRIRQQFELLTLLESHRPETVLAEAYRGMAAGRPGSTVGTGRS
jgi:glycosyltransferase involved in cell wall biosynthesis